MVAWKDHVAKSMRGKKFGSRQEANAFMKKLSEEWRSKKTGGTIDEFQVTAEPSKEGAGKRRKKRATKPKVVKIVSEDPDSSEEEVVEGGRLRPQIVYRKIGGSTSLLLSRGLGDGCHLSVLPK
jgi:hypothetical protein